MVGRPHVVEYEVRISALDVTIYITEGRVQLRCYNKSQKEGCNLDVTMNHERKGSRTPLESSPSSRCRAA